MDVYQIPTRNMLTKLSEDAVFAINDDHPFNMLRSSHQRQIAKLNNISSTIRISLLQYIQNFYVFLRISELSCPIFFGALMGFKLSPFN